MVCPTMTSRCCSAATAAELKLPANLKTVEDEAFMGDQSLTAVVIPDGLETIGEGAFAMVASMTLAEVTNIS